MTGKEKKTDPNREAASRSQRSERNNKGSSINAKELIQSDQVMTLQELNKNNEFLSSIMENNPAGIVSLDTAGQIIYANPAAEKVLRLSRSKIINRRYNDPQWRIFEFAGEPYPEERLPFHLVKRKMAPVSDIRHAIKHEDGSIAYLSIHMTPLRDDNGNFNGATAVIQDITQEHLDQQELLRKTSEVAQLFDISIPLCLINKDFEIIRVNYAYCRAFQVKAADIVGRKCHETRRGPNCHTDHCLLEAALAGNESGGYEYEVELPNKDRKTFLVQARPYRDENGTITGIVETFTDITDEKLSREQIETMWNVSPDLLCVADFHTATFLKVNPAFRKVLGYRETEMLSRSFMDFVHPEDVQSTRAIIEDKLKHGETVIDFTNRYRCKDGTYRYLQWISRPLKEKGITYAIARDITRQRNAELSLQREKAWSERLINQAPDIIIGLGEDSTIQIFNNFAEKLTGYKAEEVMGRKWIETFIPEENRETIYRVWDDIVKNKQVEHDFENEILTRSKERRLIEWSNAVITEKGEFLMVLSLGVDITKRRQAEQSLRETTALLGATGRIAGVGGWEVDPRNQTVTWTEETYRIHEVPLDHQPSIKEAMEFFHPTDRGVLSRAIERAMQTGEPYDLELRLITRKGRQLWVRTICEPQVAGDRVIKLKGIVHDITERKKADMLLRKSEAKFKSVFESANAGKSITLPTGEILVNKAFCDMLGYTPEELRQTKWQDITPADEVESIQKRIDSLINGEMDSTRFEKRYLHKNGSFVWADVSVALDRDAAGNPLCFQTTVVDITRRRQAEQALRENEKKLQSLLDQAPAALFLHKMDGSIIEYNKLSLETYGYSREELLKLKAGDIDPDYQEREDRSRFWRELTEKKQIRFEARHKKKDGTVFPVEVHLAPIEINDEKYVLALAADITARKLSQQALRESEEKYRTLVNSTLQGVVISKSDPIRLVFVNPAMAGICGYAPERLVGMKPDELSRLTHEEDRERFFTNFKKRIQGLRVPQSSEYRLVAKDGSVKWVALYSSRIEYEKEPAILTTFMDITGRRRTEEKLREREKQYAFLAETAFDLVKLRSIQDIYAYTAGKLHELVGDESIIGIVEYIPDLNLWRMKHIRGVDDKYVQLSKIFGSDIRKLEGEINTKFLNKIMRGKLEEVEFDIPALFNNKIPNQIGNAVKKLLSIDKMYCIAFQENEKIFGNITLVLRKNARPLNVKLIESFILQVTNFVKKQKSEEALQSSETKFRALVDQAAEMLFLHDLHGNVLEVNTAAIQSTGYSREELEKMNVLDIDPDAQDRDDRHTHWLAIKPDDPAITIEGRHKRKDGSIYPAEITLSKIAYSGAQYILGLARDITERKEAENVLLKMKDNLEIQVSEKTRELQERVAELERFHDATIEREFRIKELRSEIERLKTEKK